MKIAFIFILISFGANYAYSQNNEKSKLELYNSCIAKADSLIVSKNYAQAIKYLDKGLELNINEQVVLFKRGIAYFGLQNNEKAVEDFTGIIKKDEKNAPAYYFRALAKMNIHSKNPESSNSACEDLYNAKKMGYAVDFTNYKEVCPDL